jgi:hypothetical protein
MMSASVLGCSTAEQGSQQAGGSGQCINNAGRKPCPKPSYARAAHAHAGASYVPNRPCLYPLPTRLPTQQTVDSILTTSMGFGLSCGAVGARLHQHPVAPGAVHVRIWLVAISGFSSAGLAATAGLDGGCCLFSGGVLRLRHVAGRAQRRHCKNTIQLTNTTYA